MMGIHEPSFPFKGLPEAVELRFGMIGLTKHTVLLHLPISLMDLVKEIKTWVFIHLAGNT